MYFVRLLQDSNLPICIIKNKRVSVWPFYTWMWDHAGGVKLGSLVV